MEQLEKRMDVAEQKIKELCEDLNRRFDQLVEMIRKGAPCRHKRGNLGARPPQQHAGQHTSRRPIYVEASKGEKYDDTLE
ncbi:hypothetical protein ZWY2020_041910 [Hordeum vulgare]|nr:hypothetical protein ZWY2020_041910 [Hordeum vulgare]